jgi:hypothetical protein
MRVFAARIASHPEKKSFEAFFTLFRVFIDELKKCDCSAKPTGGCGGE